MPVWRSSSARALWRDRTSGGERLRGEGISRKVSVALATYCGERFLQPLLDSISGQNRLPDELIVCDDGSNDDTMAILSRFADSAEFPVIIFQHPKNVGVLENFYSAFDRTSGDIIFYCDQDDVWLPEKIEKSLTPFEDPDIQFVAHRSLVVNEALQGSGRIPTNRRYGKINFPVDTQSAYAFGHQMAFRREVRDLMASLRPELETLAPGFANNFDSYIPFCASLLGALYLLPEPLIQFRRHDGSVSPLAKEAQLRSSRLQHLAATAARRARDSRQRLRLFERARQRDLLPSARSELAQAAYRRQAQISQATHDLAKGALPLRLARAVQTFISIGWPRRGFSNDRRIREIALAAASLTVGNKQKL